MFSMMNFNVPLSRSGILKTFSCVATSMDTLIARPRAMKEFMEDLALVSRTLMWKGFLSSQLLANLLSITPSLRKEEATLSPMNQEAPLPKWIKHVSSPGGVTSGLFQTLKFFPVKNVLPSISCLCVIFNLKPENLHPQITCLETEGLGIRSDFVNAMENELHGSITKSVNDTWDLLKRLLTSAAEKICGYTKKGVWRKETLVVG